MPHRLPATQSKVIVSVEDTTEYILPQGRGLVVQREIGADCASREEALAMALQQDADVILLDGIGNEREAGLLFAAVRRGQFVILAEKEDSVTAALLHLVQCGGAHPVRRSFWKVWRRDWRGLWRRSCCGGRMKPARGCL